MFCSIVLLFLTNGKFIYGQNRNSTEYIIAKTHVENALELKNTDAKVSFSELDTALEFANEINDDMLLADVYYAKAKVYDACQKYDDRDQQWVK